MKIFDQYKLANGVRVILVPTLGVESVAVGLYVQTGSRYETSEINGISHFLEHMVFKGTEKFPTHKDTSYLEGLGAIQNAWTDVDATAYWCKIVWDKWREALEMVKELALYPRLPANDLEIERGVILEEINRKEDKPDELSWEVLQKMMYPGNPLGMTVLGDPAVIKKVTREDFVTYRDQQYSAGNLAVVLAGKIPDIDLVKEQIENWFSRLPAKVGRKYEKVGKSSGRGPYVEIYHKKTADQVHFQLGVPGVSVSDTKRYPLAVLTSYLGHGLSSRLFVELREKRGLCYEVNATSAHLDDVGFWSVYAGVAKSKFHDALGAVWAEMKRLTETQIEESELSAAKEKLRGQMLFAKENPIHQMDFYARQLLDKPNSVLDYDTVTDSLMQITTDEVMKIAQELFAAEKLNLAVAGEVDEKEKEPLAKIISV